METHTIQSTWWNHRFGVGMKIPIIPSWWKKSRKKHQDFFHPTVMYTPPKFNTHTPNDVIVSRPVNFSTYVTFQRCISCLYMDYIWTIYPMRTQFSPTWDPLNIQYQKGMGIIESVQTQSLHIEITKEIIIKQQPHQKKHPTMHCLIT